MAPIPVRFLGDYAATLGEGPLWSVEDNALYWHDVMQKKILRLRKPFERVEVRDLPYRPSSLASLGDNKLFVAYKKGVGLFDFETGKAEQFPLDDISFEHVVFNDGACDRANRFWIGTRDREIKNPIGALYSFGPDLIPKKQSEGLILSNGMAWSPDGKTFYHADSRPGKIEAYDFDIEAGSLSNRRTFLDYAGKTYRPDGCTVDSEGGLWVAEIDGFRVSRYTPNGEFDRAVALPLPRPTSVMFGGENLSTLFVTSMRNGLSSEELKGFPQSGLLMAIDVGVRGLAEPIFKFNRRDSR